MFVGCGIVGAESDRGRGSESAVFWVTHRRAEAAGRVGRILVGRVVMREAAAGLPRSNPLVLKWSETEQGKPMRMAFAGHQFPRALADALGKPAAHETPMIEEEAQQIQIGAAQMATQGEVSTQPRVEVLHQRAAARGPRHGLAQRVKDGVELAADLRPQPVPPLPIRRRGGGQAVQHAGLAHKG
jgi:hypothetical protein